ncbi:roundabout homolog 1-like isoform X2 [Actinia tenebrosa]|uniref:Roundabout homolog 1-like isoform X2 n=1 Tax=Actinia tenebrosa TaxID=6105 RepID=A0A6P8J1W1_ACTTE|nr:roundabout homolog 1-like isoform X2 [Actinia tenebrosa]
MGFRPAIIFTAVAVFLHNFGFSSSQSFIEHPQDDFQIKGGTVTFSCQATGLVNPTYYWLKDGSNVTRGNSYVNSKAYLTITRVTFDDAGLYSCRASSNTVIITSNQARLTVEGSPEVVQPPSAQSPHVGQTASFTCKVIGNPLPTVVWYYKGSVLSNGGRIKIFDNGTLIISSVMKSDAGQYKLEAKNDLGVTYASVELTVLGFPRFTISPFNKVVKENQSVTFNCAATSEPSPTIQWLLPNGTTITSHSMPSGNVRVLSNNTLVIDKVAEDHGGIYKCVTTNSLGSKQHKAVLSVLFPPRFASHLQNITKTRGQELTFTCPARGNPTPKFQWIFGGNVVENQQTLIIPALRVINQGDYVCRVNNSMGVASSTFYLRVYTLPNITTAPANVTVAIGSTASFHCQAQGDPTPSVTWLKSDVVIGSSGRYSVLSNGTLSITMATVSDQGLFSCRAENAAGRDERKAYLVVTDPPKFTESPSNTTVSVGTSVTLRCRAVAQDTPSIMWYKVANGGTLQQVTSAVTLPSGDLSFSSVQRADRSMYACRACNAAGCNTTPNVMLNVLYGPAFPVPPTDVGVLQGQDAVLKCEPDSSPKAQITWRRPNRDIMEGTGYEQTIRNVQPGDTGEYTCKASNPYGYTLEVKIILEIQTKPVIVNLLKQEQNSETTVTCKVEGTPTPTVKWYLEKKRLPLNNYAVTRDNKLVVPIGSLENKTFLCNASNPQGSVVYFAKVPEPLSSLSITEVTSHSLRATWVRPNPPEILIKHYLLEVWSTISSTWQSFNSSIEESFYDVTQLLPFTMYKFRVKAANGLGTSKIWRTSENVTTLSYKPSAPRDLGLIVQSAYAINVTWSVPRVLNGPLDDLQYHVIYEPKSPNSTNKYDVTHDPNVGTQHYILVDLEPDLRYTVQVVAWRRRSDGTKLQSNGASASARTLQLVPTSPPIGLIVEASGPNRILVKWKKPPYSVSGYNIWYRQNRPGMTHMKVNIPDGSATTYLIMNLEENTEYQVKVQMYSNVGEGPFSKYYDVRTSIDAFMAGQNQEDKGTNWEVAVGGLVSGLLLLLIVIGIIWCLRSRSQQSNQTFRVSTRRGGTHSDFAPSSVESDGTVEGNYNVAYNYELDHNLDIDMFSDDGNVIPISTSYSNERAIQYLASSQPDVNMGHREDSSEAVYTNLPRNGPSDTEGNNNDTRGPDLAVNNEKTNERVDASGRDTIDVHERAPVNNNLDKPEVGIPVYAQVDLSMKKKNRKTSVDGSLEHYPTIEFDHGDNIDEEDISEVPYPEEDLPPLERTWTNVSEFNFPPPPSDPPPNDPEVPNADGDGMQPTNNGTISYEDPYVNVTTENPIDKESDKAPSEKGPKKRRMVAAWAEDEDQPIGNLWEAVDKELDRRLGYS